MFRFALAQLRHSWGRSLALLMAIGLATTSFTVLTGAAETTRLAVRGAVDRTFRSSYDLLVRPPSSYTQLEREQGLVRPNYQSGIFGGITTDQLEAIRSATGVEVAAPVSNIGYVHLVTEVKVPVLSYLNSDTQQLFRIRPVWTMDRGTSRFVGTPLYVYVSRNKTVVLPEFSLPRFPGAYPTYAEVVPGRRHPVAACANYLADQMGTSKERKRNTPFSYRDPYTTTSVSMSCFYPHTHPRDLVSGPAGAGDPTRMGTIIPVSLPVLLTAVDPVAETQLSGLDRAVVSGRPLTAEEHVVEGKNDQGDAGPVVPVLAASSTTIDQQVSATVERVRPPRGGLLSDALTTDRGLISRVGSLAGATLATSSPITSTRVYLEAVHRASDPNHAATLGSYWTVGPSSYGKLGGRALAVRAHSRSPESQFASTRYNQVGPVGSDDAAVRRVTNHPVTPDTQDYTSVRVVGQFDPARLLGNTSVSGIGGESYLSPLLPGADEASRRALGGWPLAPSSNLGGYAAQPPALLTTLAGAAPLLDPARYAGASPTAPISVVRVRVSGVTGADPVSRERLNQAALAIARRTGLAVDIVSGASGVPTTVVLPPGDRGRPELRLLEQWARKGVAYTIVAAVDRKSLALFLLILGVCTLVIGNAAAAAVRTRRAELGVLSCLGWPGKRLFGVVITELAVVGLLAGLLGTGIALPLAHKLGLAVSPGRALLAVPAAVLLAVLAALSPAARAARSVPMDAVRPLVRAPRRTRPVRSVAALARLTLRRVPGRTALAAVSLAIGVAGLTVLLAVQQTFRGLVVGSVLGDAVALQVRAPDVVALVAILVLGAAGVADVLYLTVREQAGEFAMLRATGWTDAAVHRLVVAAGIGIGLLGGLLGMVTGLLAVAGLAGQLTATLLPPALLAALIGVALAVLASLVPAALVRRLPTAALLAEER